LPKPSFINVDDHLPTSCAIHSYKSKCEESCGLGSLSGGCFWRGFNGNFQSKYFATCSPDFSTCPDQFCDELERMNPKKICPQDCIEEDGIKGQNIALNDDHKPPRGILKGFGVCTCNDFCQCFPADSTPLSINENHERQRISSSIEAILLLHLLTTFTNMVYYYKEYPQVLKVWC
ncbi:Proto-oncogene tyrosine-protein kinase receptor Ret, partial [Armadillidium vulgare]